VTKGHSFRTCDWAGATGFVERLMGSCDLVEEIGRAAWKKAAD
jgi:hypothetical protein